MKLELWLQGATAFDYLKTGVELYEKRIKHMIPFELNILSDIKNAKTMSEEILKIKEGENQLKKIENTDFLILLDEKGKEYNSLEFSVYVENMFLKSNKRVIFMVGGAYGFSENVYKRADAKWSLSKLTFSHQMIRLFAVEQIYRALSITKGLPYHHE